MFLCRDVLSIQVRGSRDANAELSGVPGRVGEPSDRRDDFRIGIKALTLHFMSLYGLFVRQLTIGVT